MNDYDRIAQIIRLLDERHAEQPDLASLAGRARLSQHHFHRLFAKWAGVTPKDYLQCLTAAHARRLLRNGHSVLDTALETGLSGPSRLHDLCVTLEAASPGELKSAGTGWTLTYGYALTPFGKCLMAESPRGLCHLAFIEPGEEKNSVAALHEDWPEAKWRRDDAHIRKIAEKIFARPADPSTPVSLRAFVRGTAFQVRVWRALLQIPAGGLTSYGRLAETIEKPSAARAVGTAVGQNPLAYLIPCHRVIRETGVVGDYRWGHTRKQAIIAWESSIKTGDNN